jgi:thiol-disulfide isomerase/thioredoxin
VTRGLVALVAFLAASAAALVQGADARLARAAGMEAYPVPLRVPAFELASYAGEPRAKDAYRGRVVLLNFWATWCPPCRDEFPSLERLQRRLGGADFAVVAITVKDSPENVARFLGGRPAAFDILMDDDMRTTRAYRAAGVPVTYLLDRDGRLVAGRTGPQPWDTKEVERLVESLVAEKGGGAR